MWIEMISNIYTIYEIGQLCTTYRYNMSWYIFGILAVFYNICFIYYNISHDKFFFRIILVTILFKFILVFILFDFNFILIYMNLRKKYLFNILFTGCVGEIVMSHVLRQIPDDYIIMALYLYNHIYWRFHLMKFFIIFGKALR